MKHVIFVFLFFFSCTEYLLIAFRWRQSISKNTSTFFLIFSLLNCFSENKSLLLKKSVKMLRDKNSNKCSNTKSERFQEKQANKKKTPPNSRNDQRSRKHALF